MPAIARPTVRARSPHSEWAVPAKMPKLISAKPTTAWLRLGAARMNPMVNEARILAVVPSDAATTQVKRVMIVPATIALTSDATMARSPSVSAAVPPH